MGISKLQILEIKIIFNVTDKVERFVNVFAILGSKVYLIDAGVAGALEQISSALQKAGRSIEEIGAIMLTHTHPDHIGCAKQIKGLVPQCKIYVSAKEKEWLEDIEVQYKERPIPNFHAIAGSSVQADALLHPGDSTALEDDIQLDVIDCSGHSHGSIGYLWKQKKVLFSGDAVPAVDDAPIFSHLGNSIDTIHRLRELESLEVIYSAWEDSKQGAAIKDSLTQAKKALTTISSAIDEICGQDVASFMSPEEKYQKICQSAGLTHFQNHPLFSRSVAAGINEYYADVLHKTQKNLNKRGFTAIVCAKASEVEGTVSKLFANAELRSIGFGNSQTIRLCGLVEWAKSVAENVYQHDPRNFSAEVDRQALFSDVYFLSANAVSEKGHIINIDGTGNRVSATCFGPKEVVYVVGRNKISPTLETAVDRAKQAAVHLATFYQRNTPCAKTGRCHDCLSPECVCGVTTVHRKVLIGNSITVILVNEDLGL